MQKRYARCMKREKIQLNIMMPIFVFFPSSQLYITFDFNGLKKWWSKLCKCLSRPFGASEVNFDLILGYFNSHLTFLKVALSTSYIY